MKILIYFEQRSSIHLPWVTFGVGVIIEPFEKDEKLAGRCVLFVKEYGDLDSWFIVLKD